MMHFSSSARAETRAELELEIVTSSRARAGNLRPRAEASSSRDYASRAELEPRFMARAGH